MCYFLISLAHPSSVELPERPWEWPFVWREILLYEEWHKEELQPAVDAGKDPRDFFSWLDDRLAADKYAVDLEDIETDLTKRPGRRPPKTLHCRFDDARPSLNYPA